MRISSTLTRTHTMPGATLEAFADHGQVSSDTMTGSYDDSRCFRIS